MRLLHNIVKDNFGIELHEDVNWLILEDLIAEMLCEVLSNGKSHCKTSASILCGQWFSDKTFPDGTHFWIKADNEWGFESGYLYRMRGSYDN